MAGVLVPKAANITPIGQASYMECWLASYTMLLQQNNSSLQTSDVLDQLAQGGFADGAKCKSAGLLDSQFPAAAQALGLGSMLPGCVCSISGMRTKLLNYGALWLAFQPMVDGTRFHHIIIVIGVDEERNQVWIINPWKQNPYDLPSKMPVDWQWVRDGIVGGSESVDAGCQYLSA